MSSHEDLDTILKRLEDGTQTEADVAALRQLLRGEGRSEVVQQLAKYNIHMDKAEGIQIGDRYYNTPKQETAEVDFRRYLRSLTEEYQHWWEKYTLTDALGRERKREKGRSPSECNFDLMVQTARRQEPEEQREEKEKIERFPVLEGLRKYAKDHVLLVGRPGSGKSTALVRLLLEEAALTPLPPSPNSGRGGSRLESEVSEPEGRPPSPAAGRGVGNFVSGSRTSEGQIPVLVELRFWQTSMLDRILKFLQKHDPELNLSEQTVEALLKKGRLLLLVDGLNELPSEEARQDVARFRNDYRKTTPMVFTTRELSVGCDLGIEKKLEMQPLTEGQMRSFVKAYLPERGDALLAQLKDRLRELGQTPLLLAMLCSIFQNTEQLPNNLGEVFRQFTQFYENGLKQDVPVSDESRRWWRPLLERLAFVMMHEDSRLTSSVDFRVAISQREALETFREFLQGEVNDPGDRAIECLDDLLEHHLIQLNGNRIEFRHQLLQEYYAAEYLLTLLPELDDVQLQCNYLNYLKWTETIKLMQSLLTEEKQIVRLIHLIIKIDFMLATELINMSGGEFVKRLHEVVKISEAPQKVKNYVMLLSQPVPAELDFHNLFSETQVSKNSAEYKEILLESLSSRDFDTREYALMKLVEIYGEEEIKTIEKFIRRETSPELIALALSSIGKLGGMDSIELVEELLNHRHWMVRLCATQAISSEKYTQLTSNLIGMLEDDDYDVRGAAAKTLGKIGTDQAVNAILLALEKADEEYSLTSHFERFQICHRFVVEALCGLKDASLIVHEKAVKSLKNIGKREAILESIGDIQNALEGKPGYWMTTAEALAALGNQDAEKVLCELLEGAANDVNIELFTVPDIVKRLRLKSAIPYLENIIHSPLANESVADVLASLGVASVLPRLIQLWEASRDMEYRQAISKLRNQCKFYNYELYQQAQSQAEESDRPQTTQPIVQMIFNERVYGVAGNVEGDFNSQISTSPDLQDNET